MLALILSLLIASTTASPACEPLHAGAAPNPVPNTPAAFSSFPYYTETALEAAHPAHYERFLGASHAAVRDDASYITYQEMDTYDVDSCATACDEMRGCEAFNIYFQRHPSLAPGLSCPNPPAMGVIRCAFFATALRAEQATNEGQVRGPADEYGQEFQVLVAGSNAYNRLVSPFDQVTVTKTRVQTAVTTFTQIPVITVTETETQTQTQILRRQFLSKIPLPSSIPEPEPTTSEASASSDA